MPLGTHFYIFTSSKASKHCATLLGWKWQWDCFRRFHQEAQSIFSPPKLKLTLWLALTACLLQTYLWLLTKPSQLWFCISGALKPGEASDTVFWTGYGRESKHVFMVYQPQLTGTLFQLKQPLFIPKEIEMNFLAETTTDQGPWLIC